MKSRAIFLTNNGLADHIGVAQVLPYLEGLAQKGHTIGCISIESPDQDQTYQDIVKPRLIAAGIAHYPIRRSRFALVRKWERFVMQARLHRRLVAQIKQFQPDIVHCRSYMPLGATLKATAKFGVPFIFDMRGFWIDQRLESGNWPLQNPFYKAVIKHFRKLESRAFTDAAGVVVLTQDAKDVVTKRPDYKAPFVIVAPCSVQQSHFNFRADARQNVRSALGYRLDDIVLAYLGSSGPLYPMEAAYRLFGQIKAIGGSPKLLMLGTHNVDFHIACAKADGIEIAPCDITAHHLRHDQVPDFLSCADVGLSPLIQTFSSLGVSATKTGEYLSCGLPVISNAGVGDVDKIIQHGKTGWILADFSHGQIAKAAAHIVGGGFLSHQEINRLATKSFDIDSVISKYDELYGAILAGPGQKP